MREGKGVREEERGRGQGIGHDAHAPDLDRPKAGSISYARQMKESERSYRAMMEHDMNGDGVLDESDMAASMLRADRELEEAEGSLELREARRREHQGDDNKDDGNDDDNDNGDDGDDDDDDGGDDDHVFNLEPVDMETYLEQPYGKTLGASTASNGGVYILKSFVSFESKVLFDRARLTNTSSARARHCASPHT